MNLRKWFAAHSLKLLAIRDTPEAIAGGVAIGIFFGFTPLFGLKTLMSLLVAWLTRSNLIAAAIAVTLHDLLLPFMPVIYRLEYDVGYWLLSRPHHLPARLHRMNWGGFQWQSWTTFLTVGKPWLLGSVVCGLPIAVVTYLVTKKMIERHQMKKVSREAANDPPS